MRKEFWGLGLALGVIFLFWGGCAGQGAVVSSGVPVARAFSGLTELTDAFVRQLGKETEARKVFVERETIRDMNTGEVWNFSGYLLHELEASLTREGFHLVYEDTDADILLGATYQQHGDQIRVFFRCHQLARTVQQTWDYEMASSRVPADAFEHTLEGKAARLVQDLTAIHGRKRIYVRPILDGNQGFVSDFSRSFTARLKTQMVKQWPGTVIIDEGPVFRSVFGKRGVEVVAREIESQELKDLSTLEAAYTDADTLLEGMYFVEGDRVTVNLSLKGVDGRLFGPAQSIMARELIAASLENPQAAALAELGDTANKGHDARVRILTNLGGDFPVYREGETMSLFVQTLEPLYVYVYFIDSRGSVTRLYPHDPSLAQRVFKPGVLSPLPSDDDPFEYRIIPPFGIDMIKAFASPVPLTLPLLSTDTGTRSFEGATRKRGLERTEAQQALARERTIHPRDLVDYYRGLAAQQKVRLHEDQVMVETRKREDRT